jgi:cellulose synthase (UDP-forming)
MPTSHDRVSADAPERDLGAGDAIEGPPAAAGAGHDRAARAPLADAVRPPAAKARDLAWRIGIGLSVAYAAAAVVYLAWRITVFNTDAPVFASLFYAAELYGVAVSLMVIFVCWRRVERRARAPAPGLTVDVFVTTYNEPIAVLRRTLLGARRIRYPHQTWLLDDGNRAEMKALAKELGCRYLARETNRDAKAGNLNNALAHSDAAFVALLDADNVPRRDFLDALLGYFEDPAVAFVQTPQDFYNTNSFQHSPGDGRTIWNEQSFFHHVEQPGCDAWQTPVLCGSSAVVRRSALDAVGGFAVETVTEDIHTAIRMNKLGYRAVYHPVALAYGIAPADLQAYLHQRLRWGIGNLQVCRREKLPFGRGLSWPQRLTYFNLTIHFVDGWQKLVFYVAPIVTLLAGVPPFRTTVGEFAAFFIPYMALSLMFFSALGRGFGRPFAIEIYNMARFATYALSTFGFFRGNVRFRVSSKRLVGRLAPLTLLPQIAILVLSLAGVAVTAAGFIAGKPMALSPDVALIVGAWALVNVALAIAVIVKALRTARNRDADFVFRIPVPALIEADRAPRAAAVAQIALDRITLTAAEGTAWSAGTEISGTLFLPEDDIAFRAQVLSVRREPSSTEIAVDCAFLWAGQDGRDRLDVALHASCWYRPLVGQREAGPTCVDWALRLFGKPKGGGASAWEPALYRVVPDLRWRGGYIRASEPGELAAFGRLPENAVLEVMRPGSSATAALQVKAGRRRLDADAEDDSAPLVHAIGPIGRPRDGAGTGTSSPRSRTVRKGRAAPIGA